MQEAAVKPICPRCGYDLGGLIAAWTQSCPLRSTCSECGLDFDCSRALSPRVIGPRWSYEHGFTREASRWRFTSYVAVLPRKLFGELAVDHRVNAPRLVWFTILWLALIHVTTAVLSLGVMLNVLRGPAGMPGMLGSYWYEDDFLSFALTQLVLPYTGVLRMPIGASFIQIPLLPLFILVYVPTFLMPAWLMLLGTSLRMARVRKVHLLRGVAYSVPCAALCLVACVATTFAVPLAQPYLGLMLPRLVLAGVVLFCLGHHLTWWYLFIRRYLRLRHAAAVVLLNSVMSVLVVMIVLILLSSWSMRL